eukprot:SAG31_NODE_44511_length_262_cov_0.957055_1_plen_86_part_11
MEAECGPMHAAVMVESRKATGFIVFHPARIPVVVSPPSIRLCGDLTTVGALVLTYAWQLWLFPWLSTILAVLTAGHLTAGRDKACG